MGSDQSTQTEVEEVTGKHQNGELNGHAVHILENGVPSEVAVQQNSEPSSTALLTETGLEQADDAGGPVPEDHQSVTEKVEQETHVAELPIYIPHPAVEIVESQEKVYFFGKLFKKKRDIPSSEENVQETESSAEDQTAPVTNDTQPVSTELKMGSEQGEQTKADDAGGPVPEDHQTVTEKVEQESPVAEPHISTPHPAAEIVEPQETSVEKVNFFGKLFKKKREIPSSEEKVQEPESSAEDQTAPVTNDTQPVSTELKMGSEQGEQTKVEQQESPVAEPHISTPHPAAEIVEPQETSGEKVNFFGKLFKKKRDIPSSEEKVQETESSAEDQTAPITNDTQPEAAQLKGDTETSKETNCVSVDPPEEVKTPEVSEDHVHPEQHQEQESDAEEHTVMNFFKSLVNPSKTSKKETAIPDVAKDQHQMETPPTTATTTTAAAATTVAQVVEPPAPAVPKGMNIPPPPPPEPPRPESKAETAPKPAKAAAKDEPKDAGKEPEPAKGKSTKDGPFSKLFRSKVLLGFKASKSTGASTSGAKVPVTPAAVTAEAEPQPVEVQSGVKVEASSASTLEADVKLEPPPPVQEEKKEATKTSAFRSFFKPSKAAESKKEPSAPPAEAEAGQALKVKEEPKAAPAPAVKSPEAPADKQSVSGTSLSSEEAASMPRREKRNSIHLFFKNLGQKRHSDAGVQTEPVNVVSPPEKTSTK